jgi:hypothetical protein
MADMIVKVARTSENDVKPKSSTQGPIQPRLNHLHLSPCDNDMNMGPKNTAIIAHSNSDAQREDIQGISRQREVQVYVGDSESDYRTESIENSKEQNRSRANSYESQVPLKDLGRLTEAR